MQKGHYPPRLGKTFHNLEHLRLSGEDCTTLFSFSELPSLKTLIGHRLVNAATRVTPRHPSFLTSLSFEDSDLDSERLAVLLENIRSLKIFRYSYRLRTSANCQPRTDVENLIRHASHSLETQEMQGHKLRTEKWRIPEMKHLRRLKRLRMDRTMFVKSLVIPADKIQAGDVLEEQLKKHSRVLRYRCLINYLPQSIESVTLSESSLHARASRLLDGLEVAAKTGAFANLQDVFIGLENVLARGPPKFGMQVRSAARRRH